MSGGGVAKRELAIEGAAMLRALSADAARVPGWQVVVAWDSSLEPFGVSGVDVLLVRSPEDERTLFERLTREADRTLVIAPESDGLLEARCRLVNDCGGRFVGPTAAAIALCGDKLALAGHLERRNVPAIETRSCDFSKVSRAIRAGTPAGFVVKPRHGAGSIDTFRVTNGDELNVARNAYPIDMTHDEPIVQPFVPGAPLSIAAIVSDGRVELFPVCRQRIAGTTRLHYAGGSVSTATCDGDAVRELVRRTLAAVPGLSGYVGIDLLLPDGDPGRPLVVEINPRLTSSYHGYRRLTATNLAERILTPEVGREPIRWRHDRVEFDIEGNTSLL
ncbi:MAG: ATP-grasp domain-containing protein [Planctomycetaceae bacterium]